MFRVFQTICRLCALNIFISDDLIKTADITNFIPADPVPMRTIF